MGKKGKAKRDNNQDQQQEQSTQPKVQEPNTNQNEAPENSKVEVLQPKKIQYCPVCTLPFELCKYGKKASDCKKFLMEIAPTKVSKYHPDSNTTQTEGVEGGQKVEENQKIEEKANDGKEPQEPKQHKEKKEKGVKDKFIHIDVKQRDRKKFVSEIWGLTIFKIDGKDLAKKLAKKFACSCSAIDADKVQVQGDFFEEIKEILINEYKIKKKYILDKDQFKEKLGEQKEKKKAQRKLNDNTIKQEPEEEQKDEKQPQPEPPKAKTAAQNMLEGLSDEQQN